MLKKDLYRFIVMDILQLLLSFISCNFSLLLSYYTKGTAIEILFVVLTAGMGYSMLYSFEDISKTVKEYRLSNSV